MTSAADYDGVVLQVWCVFRGTADIPPGTWTVRRRVVTNKGEDLPEYGPPFPVASLEQARARVPDVAETGRPGEWCNPVCIGRQDGDVPALYEVWL